MADSTATNSSPVKGPAIAALSILLIAGGAHGANAQSYLHGQSQGLQKCVRAVLGGYEAKHVRIRGHHFNCKGMKTGKNGLRRFQLSHDQFGVDDQVYFRFVVDSKNVVRPNTVRYESKRGLAIKFPGTIKFRGRAGLPQTYRDNADYARQLKGTRSYKTDDWFTPASDVLTVTIAELGNPENRGTAPKQVGCKVPTFHAYDNFGGRAYTATRGEYANIHKSNRFKGLGDAMSSLCVPRGYVVHFYEHDTFRGRMWEVTGGKEFYDLGRQKKDFQDRISSFKVFENTKITRLTGN